MASALMNQWTIEKIDNKQKRSLMSGFVLYFKIFLKKPGARTIAMQQQVVVSSLHMRVQYAIVQLLSNGQKNPQFSILFSIAEGLDMEHVNCSNEKIIGHVLISFLY
jgi:hypothetical protein